MKHPVFKQSFIDHLRNEIRGNRIRKIYFSKSFKFSKQDINLDSSIEDPGELSLIMPDKHSDYDFDNSKIIYNAYKKLSPAQASDAKLWTYLTHVRYRKYMRKRWPLDKVNKKNNLKLQRYILEHWHINGVNANTLIRNGLSWLWWGAYLTYDEKEADPFILTKELFSMKDYTRTLLPSIQGRNNIFTRALLNYVKTNKKLFSPHKETKTRILTRYLNRKGGHILLPMLSMEELSLIFKEYESKIKKVVGRKSLHEI